jgi:hypothetical protein
VLVTFFDSSSPSSSVAGVAEDGVFGCSAVLGTSARVGTPRGPTNGVMGLHGDLAYITGMGGLSAYIAARLLLPLLSTRHLHVSETQDFQRTLRPRI